MNQDISTLEIIRAGWPILVALLGGFAALVTLRVSHSRLEKDFEAFKTKVQSDDKEFMMAVEKIRHENQASERRLEDKLDRLDDKTDNKLAKIYEVVNETNNILAEIKGQLKMKEKQST